MTWGRVLALSATPLCLIIKSFKAVNLKLFFSLYAPYHPQYLILNSRIGCVLSLSLTHEDVWGLIWVKQLFFTNGGEARPDIISDVRSTSSLPLGFFEHLGQQGGGDGQVETQPEWPGNPWEIHGKIHGTLSYQWGFIKWRYFFLGQCGT